MTTNSYFMRDLNGDKVERIMNFNVASGDTKSRSLFEFGVFVTALLIYIGALALSA